MPIYSYKCDKCDITIAEDRSIDERDSAGNCNKCRGALRRVYTFGAAQFKGSGFYSTDKNK